MRTLNVGFLALSSSSYLHSVRADSSLLCRRQQSQSLRMEFYIRGGSEIDVWYTKGMAPDPPQRRTYPADNYRPFTNERYG